MENNIELGIAAMLGASLTILYLTVRDFLGFDLPSWPVSVISLFMALFFSVGIHELGHVLAGLCVRYHFFFVSVGPFKLEKTAAGLKLSVGFKSPNLFGGLTLMLPDENNQDRRKMAWFVGGGPVASVLLFLLFALIAFSIHALGSTTQLAHLFKYLSCLTAVVSLTLGLIALIPESGG